MSFSGRRKVTHLLQTITRMREMSQFSCQLDVLVDGVCMCYISIYPYTY